MATLISTSDSTSSAAGGEHRFAQKLRELTDPNCLCWHKAPIGAGSRHPDFVVLDPHHGMLALEVRDWKFEQLRSATALHVQLAGESAPLSNPLHQARVYARAVTRVLAKHGPAIDCAHGLVLTEISRTQLQRTDLYTLDSKRVLCKEDLALDPESFRQCLLKLMDTSLPDSLTAAQIEHVRHALFPEVRFRKHGRTKGQSHTLDVAQEAVMRHLGRGHRVVHGVAGSGKTMLLVERCRTIAKTCIKPVLVLCMNSVLAARLEQLIGPVRRGSLVVRDFHGWCHDQLRLHRLEIPKEGDGFPGRLVRAVEKALAAGRIPKHQYSAVMIDEGHDFEPEWLKIVTQMPDAESNSLLLLYDDAQAIYGKKRSRDFSFAKFGVQARGRTSILRVNYRNSADILKCAYGFAEHALRPEEASDAEEAIPFVVPQSAGVKGRRPSVKVLASLQDEVKHIVGQLRALHDQGHAWRDMAVLYPARFIGEEVSKRFESAGIPLDWIKESGQRFKPEEDSVKAMTLHGSKGLEFTVVAIVGIGFMPYREDEALEDARLLYVGMTRASEQLILTAHKHSDFVKRLTGEPIEQRRAAKG